MAKKKKENEENPLEGIKLAQETALDELEYWQTAEGQEEARERVSELAEEGKTAWPTPNR
jgi:hypothetical protein